MWEPKLPGTLWATPGLLWDSFTFTFTGTNTSTGGTGACVPFFLRLHDDGTVAPKHAGVFKLMYNL